MADARVPVQLTSFVGRSRELAELEASLGGARLVTLVGPGGSGKTRLAVAFAHLLDRVVVTAARPGGQGSAVADG